MTARPIQPSELLDLADRLVGRGAGRGRPRTVELRSAVSSAYYAVFHQLTWRGTAELLQEPEWSPRAAAISRWISHADLRALADAARGQGSPSLRAALGTPSTGVAKMAEAFGTLQDARQLADYDDTYDLSRALALTHVDTARDAIDLSTALSAAGDASYRLFLRLMISAVQAKRRS